MKKKLLIFAVMVMACVASASAAGVQLKYRGTVAGAAIEVALNYNTGDVATGGTPYWIDDSHCRYVKYATDVLTLRPTTSAASKKWVFEEYDDKGRHTGHWELKEGKSGLTGTFKAIRTGKVYKVNLTSVNDYDEWDWAY
ncbi:MAG: hypothetical protein Q4B68_08940 [Bacteroidales bacterium]|nr:hypothetical protein [Bacteroidales bacterium]